jgi:hypothetical protein
MPDTVAKPQEQKRPRQGRSPAYPAISVKVALEKAKALYEQEGKYAVPMPSAFKAWGYGEKSSGGRETRAALKYFGLIGVEGDSEVGKVKLTDIALRVLLDQREDQAEKKALIRRIALTPAIHKKLLDQFAEGIKSDATVAHFLMFEEHYSQGAANQLVTEFKETAAFAGLYEPATMVDKLDEGDDENDLPPNPPLEPTGDQRRIQPPSPGPQVKVMPGERVVFTEEGKPGQLLKLVASGEVDDVLLEALEDFVKRQRKRLGQSAVPDAAEAKPRIGSGPTMVSFMITKEQKAALRDMGHSDADIDAMTPAHAHRLLGLGRN